MKLKKKTLIIAAAAAFLAIILLSIYLARSPVIIVTDLSLVMLYGEKRIKAETAKASLPMLRRVKTAGIADDAGEDIVQFAITGISKRPYCVIFPLRFAQAARVYREQHPKIPVVILEGRYSEEANPASFAIGGNTSDYFLYKTDINADFYRAGLAAAVLDRENDGKIAVFLEPGIQNQAREAFNRALNDSGKPLQAFFYNNYDQFSGIDNLSCVLLAGVGFEFLDKNNDIPVIVFSWTNPDFLPFDAVLLFNDSPWILAGEAAGMVSAGMTNGRILSKTRVFNRVNIDKTTLRKLRKI
jgi:hypothetical protein